MRLAGRITLPANEPARLDPGPAGQTERLFDFVSFIDAREHERRTRLSDESGYLGSATRRRLDVAVR